MEKCRKKLLCEEHRRWKDSPEYNAAILQWIKDMDLYPWDFLSQKEDAMFKQSSVYRNARLAYRRRVNGSPSSETT